MRRRYRITLSCLLAVGLSAAALLASEVQSKTSLQGALPAKMQLDQISKQTEEALHQTMRRSYPGYLGLKRTDLQSGVEPLSNLESMFGDLNHLLQEAVEPLVERGKQLSQDYYQAVGDRSYLDQFRLRELRLHGLIYSNAEEYERGRQDLQQAATLASQMGDARSEGYSLNNLAYCNFHLNRIDEALANQQQALSSAQKTGDRPGEALFLYNLGWIHINRRTPAAAEPYFEKSAALSRELNNPVHQTVSLINLGTAQLYQGKLEQAKANFQKSMELSKTINSLRYRALSNLNYAVALSLQGGQIQQALAAIQEAATIIGEEGRNVFMVAERHYLQQKAAALMQLMRAQTPSLPLPAALAGITPAAEEPAMGHAEHLHSHFAHLTANLIPESSESVSEFQAVPPQAAPRKDVIRLTMKGVTTQLNTTFTAPVYFNAPPGTKVHSITFETAFPKLTFSFNKVEQGFLLPSVNATVDSKTSPHPSDPKLEILTVTITAGEEEGNKLALPNGLLLHLGFTVPKTTPHGVATLQNKLTRAESTAGVALVKEQLLAENQVVTILSPNLVPVVICFFYIH